MKTFVLGSSDYASGRLAVGSWYPGASRLGKALRGTSERERPPRAIEAAGRGAWWRPGRALDTINQA
ncbi:MAG: hypothetical protein ABI353_12620 [Isosphaeraceae bacterium]